MSADRLAAALAVWQAEPSGAARAEVLAALAGADVYAGITATSTAEHVEAGTGLRAESSAEMALLVLEAGDERALPVFSSPAALRRWRLEARPVALPAGQVFAAAVQERASALVLDPGGADLVVVGEELAALVAGRVPVPGSGLSSRRTTVQLTPPAAPPAAALVDALSRALDGEDVVAARLLDGPDGPVLGLAPRGALDPAALAALAARVRGRLGDALPAGGLDLAAVPAQGPGHPVPVDGSGPSGRPRLRGWFSARGR